jgi:hypothetical protein
MIKTSGWVLAILAATSLAGCGSDSDSDTPVAPASVTITGTAVKGAALGAAAVTVKCTAGTGTSTTAASGAYTVAITGGELPCAVQVVATDGTTYHSLVSGTGNTGTFTANVSPLTEMVVAHVSGASPAAYFSAFGSASTIPAASVTAANDYVQVAMAGLTDLTGVNSLTDPLVVGNPLDQKIDAVVAGLAAATITVDQVTIAIVANPTAPSVVASPLAASATDCAWLKSGKYRLIDRLETDPMTRFESIKIDATALTVTNGENVVNALTSDGACQFNINADVTLKALVSSSGMLVVHAQSKTVATDRAVVLGVPEQTLPVSEFAGTWNVASWEAVNIANPGSIVASNVEITVDATGQITATKQCVGLSACASGSAPFAKFVANASGGFDLVEDAAVVGRLFLFKTMAGRKVAILLDGENSLAIAVPKDALSLPAVGTVSGFRSLQINGNNSVSSLTEDSNTVTAVDTVAKTTTRLQASNNRVDTLTYDKPRDGLRYRAGNSCTINNVLQVPACSEVVQLPLPGMGITMTLSAAAQPTPQFYQWSVGKP